MNPDSLLQGLNQAQKEAASHGDGPLLIVAGAGTGKTTVITRRFAWLAATGLAEPEDVLALTFTDKAANEMEERIDRLLPLGYVNLAVQTFHSFGETVLREHGLDIGIPSDFRVLSKTEQWLLLRERLLDLKLDYYRPLGNPTKFLEALISHFSRAADELVTPDDYLAYAKEVALSGDSSEESSSEARRLVEVAEAYHEYKRALREKSGLDFSDLVNETLRLFKERPKILSEYRERFKYVMVDEFQDTNWAQYELVKLLAGGKRNLAVVGDDDQSIYKFRGASVSNILDFENDYPDLKRVVLTRNYRSRQEILDFAYNFIQRNNPDRLEAALQGAISKKLESESGAGGQVKHLQGKTLQDEARLVVREILALKESDPEASWNDFAVLVRANDHAEPFLTALKLAGVPHEFSAPRGLYLKPLVMDILAILRLLDDYHESSALYRILVSPISNLEIDDVIKLNHFAEKKSRSLFETARQSELVPGLSPAGAAECQRIVSLISNLTLLAKTKSATAVVLTFLESSGYLKILASKSESEAREEMRILNAFWRVAEKITAEDPEPTVKNLIRRIDYELESGESGALPFDPESGPELLRVMTIHAAKGLEFKYVFLVNLVDKRFPTTERREPIVLPDRFVKERLPSGDSHLEEERRLFYVGCTRAKTALYLTSALDYGGAREKKPSRFLLESAAALSDPESISFDMKSAARSSAKETKLSLPERMSFSQFEAFQKCPLQYKFEHIYRIPKAGDQRKSFGRSVHNTLHNVFKLYSERRAASQQPLFDGGQAASATFGDIVTTLQIEELYNAAWEDDWYDSRGQMEERYKKGLAELLSYREAIKDRVLDIFGLELDFTLKVGELTIKGRIDRIDRLPDGGIEIIDYKTGAVKEKPDWSQLMIYQLAAQRVFKAEPRKLTFVYLEGGIEKSFLATGEELTAFEERLQAIAARLRTSDFAPTPDKNVCRFCYFKNICEFSAG